MDVLAELRHPREGVREVLPESARVRRGEPDPLEAGDRVHPLEQLDEGGDAARVRVVAPAVARHDLAEERDLARAARHELLALAHDVVHRARALVAPGRRDDAERAVHVAALLDRDEGAHLALGPLKVVADRVLRARLLGGVDDRLAEGDPRLAGGAQVVEVVGDPVELLGADDQVHVGQPVEELGAPVLRHAAQDPQDEVGVVLLPLRGCSRPCRSPSARPRPGRCRCSGAGRRTRPRSRTIR